MSWLSPRPALALTLLLASTTVVAQEPPNVILILADDLGAECLSCYGSTSYATPNLDRIAADGMRFTRAHAQPLCTPTRVEILTGLCNARNYEAFSVLPPDSRTFAHGLQEQGYATGVFGKWQLLAAEHSPEPIRGSGSTPAQAGFDTWCLWQVDRLGERYWNPTLDIDGRVTTFPEDAYGPDVFTDHLLRFVETHRDERFCAFFPMALTHAPFEHAPPKPIDAKNDVAHFRSMVEYMDTIVGRIADRLTELDLANDTLLIFCGDNGSPRQVRSRVADGAGERTVRGGKGSTTITGTHVPLIAWQPGTVPRSQVRDDLVQLRDLHATILQVAGAEVPPEVAEDSLPLTQRLRGGEDLMRARAAFWYHPRPKTRPRSRPVAFVSDGRFKLYGDGRLFDTLEDPAEREPLASPLDPIPAAQRRELHATLAAMPTRESELDRILADVHPGVAKWATVIRVRDPNGEPTFATTHYRNSEHAVDFWPASTIKVYTVVAALEWLDAHDLPLDATVSFARRSGDGVWIHDCARTVPEMVSEVFRRSSNEDYTLLLRMLGVDWINSRFLTPSKGFPHSALMRDYVTHRPVIYENDEPQRVTIYAEGREPLVHEHTWSGHSYAEPRGATALSATTGNCTSTAELADCLRRILFHERIPEEERFAITADQARWIAAGDPERGIVGLENREAGAFAWKGAGDQVFPDARYFHKGGYISSYSLDLCYISDIASDQHLILALAARSGVSQIVTDMARAILEAARADRL